MKLPKKTTKIITKKTTKRIKNIWAVGCRLFRFWRLAKNGKGVAIEKTQTIDLSFAQKPKNKRENHK